MSQLEQKKHLSKAERKPPSANCSTPDLIVVAEVSAAKGLKGEVKLQTFTAAPLGIQDYPLYTCGGEPLTLVRAYSYKGLVVALFAELTDRAAASNLVGQKIYTLRSEFPQVGETEFYVADLLGFTLMCEGEVVGRLLAVHNFGAGDLLEITPGADEISGAEPLKESFMIPFTQELAPSVKLKEHIIELSPLYRAYL